VNFSGRGAISSSFITAQPKKKVILTRYGGAVPVILATQEAEIGRIEV
jgi:hypothetical protein